MTKVFGFYCASLWWRGRYYQCSDSRDCDIRCQISRAST